MTGLTPFILDMIAGRLPPASPQALARKYDIPAGTAAFYLEMWRA